MHAATTIEPSSPSPVFHSAMSLAPGRPRPLARRLAIHNRVMHNIRRFMDDQKFNEIPVSYPSTADSITSQTSRHAGYKLLQGMIGQGFPAVWCEGEQNTFETNDPDGETLLTGFKLTQACMAGASLDDLADTMETLVKSVVSDLGADLLGGRHIIRLDRMLSLDHHRMTHDQALAIVNQRGFDLKQGEPLSDKALSTLTRYTNNTPFMLMDRTHDYQTVTYVFPFSGRLGHGMVNENKDSSCASFTLEVAPLLQYVMGLDSINDAAIHPFGPVPHTTPQAHQGRA
jgi:hypothetical protein